MKTRITLLVTGLFCAQLACLSQNRIWGSYFGGGSTIASETVNDIVTDNQDYVYICGETPSNSGVATTGAHQSVYGGGTFDGFIAKFDKYNTLIWSTYFGGSNGDRITSITASPNGNILVAGYTDSGNQIATSGSHQPAYGGGLFDAFVACFTSSGTRLWSTYYGASSSDIATDIAVDMNNDIYVCGSTPDGFLLKFNSAGTLLWQINPYGGNNGNVEYVQSVATDKTGNVYITGYTASTSGIATAITGLQSTFGGGTYDAFLVKFDAQGNRLWGTYMGGSADDDAFAVDVDTLNNVYVAGSSASNSAIALGSAHQPSLGGGGRDAFLMKFDSLGMKQWGTYFGGNGFERSFDLMVVWRGLMELDKYITVVIMAVLMLITDMPFMQIRADQLTWVAAFLPHQQLQHRGFISPRSPDLATHFLCASITLLYHRQHFPLPNMYYALAPAFHFQTIQATIPHTGPGLFPDRHLHPRYNSIL